MQNNPPDAGKGGVENPSPLLPGDPVQGPQKVSPNLKAPDYNALRGTLRTDVRKVAPGGKITLTYTVKNVSNQPQMLRFASGQRFDATAMGARGGTPVWQASRGMMYAMMVGSESFGPGTAKPFTATWEVPASTPPGVYTLRAFLTPTRQNTMGGPAQSVAAAMARIMVAPPAKSR